MRLHRLRLQAFGPFAGTEEIDFDALAGDGLHLIHGPTGAGKTSILDAICFALFSGVPGGRMQGRDTLHSDHAAPATRPEVELEFGVDERRLRVRRSPEHVVPKKRGAGMRTQRGSVHLEELRGHRWESVSTRSDEVAQVIGDLLGMGLPQFAQVMLLPQGEFTAFLRAKADDRAKLLERLFDISDFAAVEHWLTEHRKLLETEVAHGEAHRQALIARAQDTLSGIPVAEETHDGTSLPELDATAPGHVLLELTDQLSGRLTAALAEADTARAHLEQLRTRLAGERSLAGLQSQAFAAQQTLDRLSAQAATIAESERHLELAVRAEACRPAIAALSRRQEAQHDARLAADRARTALTTVTAWPVPETHGSGTLSDAALLPLRERAAAGTDALAGQAESMRQLRSLTSELRAVTAARLKAMEQSTRCDELVAASAARLTELTDRRATHLPDATAHPQWRDLLAIVDAAARAATTTAGDLRRVVDGAHEHRAAQLDWACAEHEVLRLRRARLAGIAAELAGELVDGQPCPVCGSCEHPQPAQPAPDQVDADRISAAEDVLAAASADAQAAAARWSSAVGRAQTTCRALLDALDHLGTAPEYAAEVDENVAAARDSLTSAIDLHRAGLSALVASLGSQPPAVDSDGPVAVSALTGALGTARESIARRTAVAAEAAQQVRTLDRQVEALGAEHLAAERTAAAAAQTARAEAARMDSLQDQVAAARDRVDELAHDHAVSCGCCSATSDVAAAHAQCVERLDRLMTATAAARTASVELDAAQAGLDRLIDEQGFADPGSASRAMLSDADRQRLRTAVDTARTERIKATGVLEQPEVAAAAGAAPADVARVTSELSVAERAARHTHEAVGDLRRAVQSLERIAAQLREHDEQSAPVRDRLAVATSLASAVAGSGDNVMRMRLTAYVLAARLETVTALANERLRVMTADRYQLEHTDAKALRGGKSGLGLRVRDAWTGTTRDTSTLSGGESFVASLALALGLGDAVLQAAGGRRLETLLVDEGFGSLDEDSLEQVLDVLDGLRAGGRTVGIVSHVAELRTRIPAQIRVRKTTSGSTLEVRRATEVA